MTLQLPMYLNDCLCVEIDANHLITYIKSMQKALKGQFAKKGEFLSHALFVVGKDYVDWAGKDYKQLGNLSGSLLPKARLDFTDPLVKRDMARYRVTWFERRLLGLDLSRDRFSEYELNKARLPARTAKKPVDLEALDIEEVQKLALRASTPSRPTLFSRTKTRLKHWLVDNILSDPLKADYSFYLSEWDRHDEAVIQATQSYLNRRAFLQSKVSDMRGMFEIRNDINLCSELIEDLQFLALSEDSKIAIKNGTNFLDLLDHGVSGDNAAQALTKIRAVIGEFDDLRMHNSIPSATDRGNGHRHGAGNTRSQSSLSSAMAQYKQWRERRLQPHPQP
ncbi:MAG: hypothetical protein ABTQ34_05600 [Bdellovibrionales bacterium]